MNETAVFEKKSNKKIKKLKKAHSFTNLNYDLSFMDDLPPMSPEYLNRKNYIEYRIDYDKRLRLGKLNKSEKHQQKYIDNLFRKSRSFSP